MEWLRKNAAWYKYIPYLHLHLSFPRVYKLIDGIYLPLSYSTTQCTCLALVAYVTFNHDSKYHSLPTVQCNSCLAGLILFPAPFNDMQLTMGVMQSLDLINNLLMQLPNLQHRRSVTQM